MIPVDHAGTDARGYTMSPEGADVARPGETSIAVHAAAANHLYREKEELREAEIRYETHSVALDLRRGFKIDGLPRFELGAKIQRHHNVPGFLNGFIGGVETFWSRLTGNSQARNDLRAEPGSLPPLGYRITENGQVSERHDGRGSGWGDVSVSAKMALREPPRGSKAFRVAARAVLNLATGGREFGRGNFLGLGLSATRKLSERFAWHGDVRVDFPLDSTGPFGFPTRRAVPGGSSALEWSVGRNTSAELQFDAHASPYRNTGLWAFDRHYGAISIGVGHRLSVGKHRLLLQVYGRENMDLPFKVRGNLDPDFKIGASLKIIPHKDAAPGPPEEPRAAQF